MNTFCKFALAVTVLGASLKATAWAQTSYPTRPVSLMIPYAAGGVADVSMRLVGNKLSDLLKQQFVIENRPGGGGVVAAETVARASPDGYTMLQTGNNTAISEALFNKLPYNLLTDFASVSTVAFYDLLIITRPESPLKSVADLVAAAKANPGKINIGTVNPGSTQNLAAELFLSTANINAAIVPFRTSPDMAGAVIRGDVDVAFEIYAAIGGLLDDKKVVALASTGPKRTAYLPDVPTVVEGGVPGYEVSSWNGISVPTATPKTVIATLNTAMKEIIPSADLQSQAARMGMEMRWSTPEDMTARMKSDVTKWGAVIQKAGIPKHD